MVEFAMVVGLLMLFVVLAVQLGVYLHNRGSLEAAAEEGAFEASLVGHGPQDGVATTRDLWSRLEPNGGAINVDARRIGNLVVVTASGTAPTLVPVPIAPFSGLPISVQADHPVEQFESGS